jgi:phenylacetate-CoA ligase
MIENTFNCPIFDYYSARDTSFHAAECPEHIGYHMALENAIVEFIKNDQSVSYGEEGEMTITDLSNYAFPFIRYKIGDVGIPTDEQCPCGRTLPLIKKIIGRVTEFVTTKKGDYIPGLFFIHIFDTPSITKYQLIQKTKDHFHIKLVKSNNFSENSIQTIIKKIKNKCGDVDVTIEYVEDIPLTPSGKYRFIISEVKNET